MDYLVRCAWEAGAWCERDANNYIKVLPANGSRILRIPSTPSGRRTYENKRKAMDRAGIAAP